MIKIGLTGGIASGKSTAEKIFHNLGVPTIDADILAHKLTAKGNIGFEKIYKWLGDDYLLENGNLNRRKLREAIFNNNNMRKKLENILHPLITDAIINFLNRQHDYPYCIVTVPLLIEKNLQNLFNRILVIDVDQKTQLHRVLQRDNIDKELFVKILATQCLQQERINAATDIITNNADVGILQQQIKQLHKFYYELSIKFLTSSNK